MAEFNISLCVCGDIEHSNIIIIINGLSSASHNSARMRWCTVVHQNWGVENEARAVPRIHRPN